jgi:hypothetical protein
MQPLNEVGAPLDIVIIYSYLLLYVKSTTVCALLLWLCVSLQLPRVTGMRCGSSTSTPCTSTRQKGATCWSCQQWCQRWVHGPETSPYHGLSCFQPQGCE